MLLAVWRMMGWADTVMEADVSSVTLPVTLSITHVCHYFVLLSVTLLFNFVTLCSLGDASNKEGQIAAKATVTPHVSQCQSKSGSKVCRDVV